MAEEQWRDDEAMMVRVFVQVMLNGEGGREVNVELRRALRALAGLIKVWAGSRHDQVF